MVEPAAHKAPPESLEKVLAALVQVRLQAISSTVERNVSTSSGVL